MGAKDVPPHVPVRANLARGIRLAWEASPRQFMQTTYVIGDGVVRESGTHHELLALGGRDAELFELQAAGYR